jgi:hypothetical protein
VDSTPRRPLSVTRRGSEIAATSGQIVDVLERQHVEAVGPWRAFLGIIEA